MVEFSSGELKKVRPHFSHNLFVRVEEDEGILPFFQFLTFQV
jgi:hypothetical protein